MIAFSQVSGQAKQLQENKIGTPNVMDWTGRKVVVLGAARQGTALTRYLLQHGARVRVNDRRSAEELRSVRLALADLESTADHPVEWVLGGHPVEVLEGADLVCVSGGVPLTLPLVAEAKARGIPLSNDSQIFLEVAPCQVIGITGSAGKTTTTSLVGRIAGEKYSGSTDSESRRKVWVGGNIGIPLLTEVEHMSPEDLAVMELSSYQLELMTVSTDIAALLNITPNHLDRHGTMEAYTAAKARLLDFQSAEDVAILSRDDPGAWNFVSTVQGELISFGLQVPETAPGTFMKDGELFYRESDKDTWLMSRTHIRLRGEHNLQNVLAACAISMAAGLPVSAIRAGVQAFSGIPHRLELVRTWNGADWYNDSIATTPERAVAAIKSFQEPLILLAGGRDKDLPWDDFAELVVQRVKHVIVFGEATGKIIAALERSLAGQASISAVPRVTRCSGLKQAVLEATKIVQPGDVILLSPGGTSFDEFRDFEERGECFRQLVMSL